MTDRRHGIKLFAAPGVVARAVMALSNQLT